MWKLTAACSSKEGVMNALEDLWNALQLHNAEDKAMKSKNFIPQGFICANYGFRRQSRRAFTLFSLRALRRGQGLPEHPL
jgi:hypothetical protein